MSWSREKGFYHYPYGAFVEWRHVAELVAVVGASPLQSIALLRVREAVEHLELSRGINDELDSSGYIRQRFGFNKCKRLVLEEIDHELARAREGDSK